MSLQLRFFGALATLAAGPTWAQTAPAAPAAAPQVPSLAGGIVDMLVGLAVVIAVLFAGLYLLKRLQSSRGAAAGLLRVVGGTAVGARERVVVVEVDDTWLVVGVGPGRVSLLHSLPRPAQSDPGGSAPAQPAIPPFAAWMQKLTQRGHHEG
ncbi:MAG: flagellar biosynthetic protein FliO [Betaproteobacteria bacterium]|nr:flagellar biosynthetic protein FliO [Betaproteobacteria bacterium]